MSAGRERYSRSGAGSPSLSATVESEGMPSGAGLVAAMAPAPARSSTATRAMRRLVRLASDPLAMLAVGSGTGPVPDGAHGATGEHQRNSGVTREDGEDRADDDAEHHEPDMEGVPGVCHSGKTSSETKLETAPSLISVRCLSSEPVHLMWTFRGALDEPFLVCFSHLSEWVSKLPSDLSRVVLTKSLLEFRVGKSDIGVSPKP